MSEKYKIIDDKMITCGIVIINSEGDILACHPNGNKKDQDYDIPKGCANEGETDLQAAIRELREETDIYFLDYDHSRIIDCGIYPHNKSKNIHLFLYKTTWFPELSQLKCSSLCKKWGNYMVPEVNGYAIIKKNERHKFMNVLQNKFEIIDKFNK